MNKKSPPKALTIEEGVKAVNKLWIIKEIVEGEIVGMSNAPGKPLEVQIESSRD